MIKQTEIPGATFAFKEMLLLSLYLFESHNKR